MVLKAARLDGRNVRNVEGFFDEFYGWMPPEYFFFFGIIKRFTELNMRRVTRRFALNCTTIATLERLILSMFV